jgi:hypothetical protein
MYAAHLSKDGRSYISLVDGLHLELHPLSLFSRFGGSPPSWIVTTSLSEQLKQVTSVKSQWLLDVAPHFYSIPSRTWQAKNHEEALSMKPLPRKAVRSSSSSLSPGAKRTRTRSPEENAEVSLDAYLDSIEF